MQQVQPFVGKHKAAFASSQVRTEQCGSDVVNGSALHLHATGEKETHANASLPRAQPPRCLGRAGSWPGSLSMSAAQAGRVAAVAAGHAEGARRCPRPLRALAAREHSCTARTAARHACTSLPALRSHVAVVTVSQSVFWCGGNVGAAKGNVHSERDEAVTRAKRWQRAWQVGNGVVASWSKV